MSPELLKKSSRFFLHSFYYYILSHSHLGSKTLHSPKMCIGNASKPCISVHFVRTLFIFASSHWESVKQNRYWLSVWFHPYPQTAAVHIHDSCYLPYFRMPPLIPLIMTSFPFVSKACFPKILIDYVLHIIFVENVTVQCDLLLLNYYLSCSMFSLSPSAPAGSRPRPDVEPYVWFRSDFYAHDCLHTFSCT